MVPADEWPVVELFNVLKAKLLASGLHPFLADIASCAFAQDVIDTPLVEPFFVVALD